jgi:hypothetical protein
VAAYDDEGRIGEVSSNSAYTLQRFKRVSGLQTQALAAARKKGLPVRGTGRRRYVIGKEFIEWLSNQAPDEDDPSPPDAASAN